MLSSNENILFINQDNYLIIFYWKRNTLKNITAKINKEIKINDNVKS